MENILNNNPELKLKIIRPERLRTCEKVDKVVLSMLCFIYLFNPRFIATDLRKVIDIISLCGMLISIILRPIRVKNGILKAMRILVIFFIYLLVGLVFHIILDSNNTVAYLNNVYDVLSVFTRCFIVSIFFWRIIRKKKYKWNDMLDIIILSGFMQLICVVLAFLFPQIKTLFNGFTIANSKSDYVAFSTKYNPYRSYGLGENLFDSFGYVTALIILLTFIEGMHRRNVKLVVLSGVMVIMPLLNARTGVVLALIGFFIAFIRYTKKSLIQSLKILLFAFGAMIVGAFFFKYIPESTQEWITDGTKSINDLLFKHKTTGVFGVLSNQFILPENLLFGEFGSPEMLGLGHSDIGYIQCIWRYGIVGTILLFWGYVNLSTYQNRITNNDRMKTFSICFNIILFVYLYKMFPFTNLGATLILLLCVLGCDNEC